MSPGRGRLLQFYWYKVPVVNIVECHLMRTRQRYFVGTNLIKESNQRFETEKVKNGYRNLEYLPPPPTSGCFAVVLFRCMQNDFL